MADPRGGIPPGLPRAMMRLCGADGVSVRISVCAPRSPLVESCWAVCDVWLTREMCPCLLSPSCVVRVRARQVPRAQTRPKRIEAQIVSSLRVASRAGSASHGTGTSYDPRRLEPGEEALSTARVLFLF